MKTVTLFTQMLASIENRITAGGGHELQTCYQKEKRKHCCGEYAITTIYMASERCLLKIGLQGLKVKTTQE